MSYNNRNSIGEWNALFRIILLLSSPLETTTQRRQSSYMLLSSLRAEQRSTMSQSQLTQTTHQHDALSQMTNSKKNNEHMTEMGLRQCHLQNKNHLEDDLILSIYFLYSAVHILIMHDPALASITVTLLVLKHIQFKTLLSCSFKMTVKQKWTQKWTIPHIIA